MMPQLAVCPGLLNEPPPNCAENPTKSEKKITNHKSTKSNIQRHFLTTRKSHAVTVLVVRISDIAEEKCDLFGCGDWIQATVFSLDI